MQAKHVWLIILAGLILIVGYQEVTTDNSDTDSIKIDGNLELSGKRCSLRFSDCRCIDFSGRKT